MATINKKAKPSKVAAKPSARRPVLEGGNIREDSTRGLVLDVTDNYKLASIPLNGCGVTPGPIGAAALKLIDKASEFTADAESVTVDGMTIARGGTDQTPPDTANMTPDYATSDAPDPEGTIRIGIDAGYLKDLADALGSDNGQVELVIVSPRKPVGVRLLNRVADSDRAVGVLMPVRTGR